MEWRRAVCAAGLLALITVSTATGAGSDPLCTGSYGGAKARAAGPLRFGVDPGLAGTVGGVQLSSAPDNPVKDLQELKALRPHGRVLVLRLNRLFWSDGTAGITSFEHTVSTYTHDGFEVELQVRYHPPSGEAGNIAAWDAYVRLVVDTFGPNRNVIAMTITNEVNVPVSPNTSDGYYQGADAALVSGIEAAHEEAVRKGYKQLRFGFTYAYRFSPQGDADMFQYIGAHGGAAFQKALGFVGLDFYPGSFYPPVMLPGDTYRGEMAQALGVVRDCLAPMARIGAGVPIWITENGVPTGSLSDAQQAAALVQLVRAAYDYAGTYNVTDYRWFNLRDAVSSGPETLSGLTFASDGLLQSNYSPKPAFADYRSLIAQLGAPTPRAPKSRHRQRRHKRRKHRKRRKR
ncbi:MAG TPA: hypothetical protein VMD48_02320 [Solirubrobacteraceae bacterium]|nr:hypothetical protein [Solirubrobacteraceae bacterium]